MTNEAEPQPTAPEPTPPASPPPDPDRSAFLVGNVARIAALITGQMLQELQGDSSTDSRSLSDRLMLAALRPWMPKLQQALLGKLSELNGADLEAHLSALAGTIDELLTAAPGDPLPRKVYRWDQGDGGLLLVDA